MTTKILVWLCYGLVCIAVIAFVASAAVRYGTGCIWAAVIAVFFAFAGHFEAKALQSWREKNERYWSEVYKD